MLERVWDDPFAASFIEPVDCDTYDDYLGMCLYSIFVFSKHVLIMLCKDKWMIHILITATIRIIIIGVPIFVLIGFVIEISYPNSSPFLIHTYTHTHTHTFTHMHTHIHIHIHTYVHTHPFTHTHIHTHTHLYTHTHRCNWKTYLPSRCEEQSWSWRVFKVHAAHKVCSGYEINMEEL